MAPSSLFNAPAASPRLLRIWFIAVLARVVYALIAPGFHARDDYFHVLAPALNWIDDPSWIWALSDTPGAGIRSHLLPKIVQGLVAFSASYSPTTQLQFIGAVLALWSSLVVPLSWPLIKQLTDTPRTQDVLALLLALHPLLIYGAPKLLIEVHCIPLIVGALSLLVMHHKYVSLFSAGLLFGLGVYIRYQAITIAPFALAWIVLSYPTLKKISSALLIVVVGTAVGLSFGGFYDLLTDGRFLGPLIQNIEVNLEPSAELTRSSPLSYLGLLLALACPWTLHRVKWSTLTSRPVLMALLVGIGAFILVHSANPHKEERFLYPVLPMLLLVLGCLWFSIPEERRRLRLSLVYFHLGLTCLLFSIQPQSGTRIALESVRETQSDTLLSLGPEVQNFYLRPDVIPTLRNRKFTKAWLHATLKRSEGQAFFVLSYAPQSAEVLEVLEANGLDCGEARSFEQNWADDLAYKLNPRHNLRRSPIEIRECRRPNGL